MSLQSIKWHGDTLNRIRSYLPEVKQRIGSQILNLQQGRNPDNWKPMPAIGKGVSEIRIRARDGSYRVIYLTRRVKTIDILHVFKKTTQKTSKQDIQKAKQRYKKLEY